MDVPRSARTSSSRLGASEDGSRSTGDLHMRDSSDDEKTETRFVNEDKCICLVPDTDFCIGSIESRHPDLLEKYNIRLIVTILGIHERTEITKDGEIEKCYRADGTSIRQILYHLVDMPGSNIIPIIRDVQKEVSLFWLNRKKAGNILFHCMAGISRSPSVVIGLLMCEGKTYEEAYEKIMEVREIEPDPCFIYQLASLDAVLKKMEIL
jgi:hypothetical protein